jgi:hypothetical protein
MPLDTSRGLFAGDMWSVMTAGDQNQRFQSFLRAGRPRLKRFIESLLLQDFVVVPTEDFMSMAILLNFFQEKELLPLLESGTLRILRVKGALAYLGNGAGLTNFQAGWPEGPLAGFCAPLDEAVTKLLHGLRAHNQPISTFFINTTINTCQEIALSVIGEEVIHETYADVLNSPSLRQAYSLRNQDLKHLVGIKPNQMRIHANPDMPDDRHDEISVLLKLAHTNLELRAAVEAGCNDASTSSPIGGLLKAKRERVANQSEKPFAILSEIAGVPDVGEAVLSGKATLGDLIKLRDSINGQDFRSWFHENCTDDPIRVAREYADLLKEVPKVDSTMGRIIRFGLTSATGFFGPVGAALGLGIGAVDSFFVSDLLRGRSPKFFIEDLSDLAFGKDRP